jgi:thiol-disulfide isomerase/thioredoxin
MTTSKKFSFIAVLILIVVSIWYLEGIKAHPTDSGNNGTPQTINVSAEATSTFPIATAEATSTTATSSNKSGISGGSNPTAGQSAPASALRAIAAADAKAGLKPAVEIASPTGFINVSSTFMLKSLIGKKVVLLDFWTYSCINCIRTLPYLTAWYSKYKDQGLVVVGIHTPEFQFEKDINNVRSATQQYGIQYPVVLDSNMGTWNAYNNLYWPHEYLIDLAGYIVHDRVGEGSYAETEGEIQQLLAQRATALGMTGNSAVIPTSTVNVTPSDLSGIGSPETYFGAERNALLANGYSLTNGTQMLADPGTTNVGLNQLYLAGSWDFEDQYAKNNAAAAKVIYKYDSAKVFFVASAPGAGVTVEVLQDGKPVDASIAGADVKDGKITITNSRLYSIINNPDGSGEHTLELIIDSPGLEAFTFTFG